MIMKSTVVNTEMLAEINGVLKLTTDFNLLINDICELHLLNGNYIFLGKHTT